MTRQDEAPRELTVRAVGFGLILGALLAAGNVYAGLKLGILDGGMSTIVLLSFGFFGALPLGGPLGAREGNAAQVAGSSAATMALTAGLVGPVPALAMSGDAPASVWIALWGAALAVLGTLLAVPFRRQLIEDEALAFPSGQATGELIASMAAGTSGRFDRRVAVLFAALAVASLLVVLREVARLFPVDVALPFAVAGIPAAALTLGIGVSPLLAGIGVLVGARVGLSLVAGAVLAWAGIAPVLVERGIVAAADYPSLVGWLLWPGAALMVGSSLAALVFGGRDLLRAWRERRADRDASGRAGRIAMLLSALAVVVLGWAAFGVNPLIGLIALALGTVFSVVSMRATGETDQTPAGPLGGLAQVVIGATAPGGPAAPLFGGGVVNGLAAHSASMQQAWKAGHVVGSAPGRLLIAQLLGIGVGALAAVVAYTLLDQAYGIGSELLPAPAALSWKATADVVQGGIGSMPSHAPMAALAGLLAGALLSWLERRRFGRWLPSPVAIGIAFIVPASVSATVALGALAFALVHRASPDGAERHGAALAAGLITGEALTALAIAALVVAGAL